MNISDMKNEVIMISGAGGQLGQTLINGIIIRGGRVIGLDLSVQELSKVASKNNWSDDQVYIIEADIRDRNAVKKAFESGVSKFGKVTSQINNAGVSVFEPWNSRSEEEIDLVMDVNLKGTFNCLQIFLQYCIDKKLVGAIVNIASHYGLVSPDPKNIHRLCTS